MFSAIKVNDEPEKAPMRLGSIMHFVIAKRDKENEKRWKGNEDFKVIHFDDYDYVLDLNFLEKVNALLFPFEDCMCVLDTRQQQCVMLVSRDLRGGTKVLSTIQVAKDIHCGKNIDSVDLNAMKTPLEMLEV
ncbi:hypothetical protein J1N35_011783 [Gossypium stocksii]|uniref:Uncharacterized protein n=1 Tax=Gossypium stocksii TaxID=47602 RepID=A0A9D4ADN8_9ROSI|nr:hypothetical protein J1N35_011783 [Gossypium stocksii]